MTKRLLTIKKKTIPLLKSYNVEKAAIFGSFARGEEKKSSDIDFLIKFGDKKSLFDLVRLENELTKLLKIKVDLLTYKSLHPLLRSRILSEQQLIL